MDALASLSLDDLSELDMANLSYEDGLAEIDSFFNSSPDGESTSVVMGGEREVHMDHAAQDEIAAQTSTSQWEQDLAQQQLQSEAAQQNTAISKDDSAAPIEGLDQVTASEAAAANPKGDLQYILNAANSPVQALSEDAQEPVDYRQALLDDASQLSQLPLLESRREPRAEGASGVPTKLQLNEQAQPLAPEQDEPTGLKAAVIESTNTEVQDPLKPVPLASAHAEQGLALLSPRPAQAHLLAQSWNVNLLPPNKARDSPLPQPTLLPNEAATPIRSRDQDITMADAPLLPEMPSSEGKSSLIEEMRQEDDDAKESIPPASSAIQLPDLATGDRSTRGNVIQEAEMVQQKAATMLANRQEPNQTGKPPPPVGDITNDEPEPEPEPEMSEIEDVKETVKPTKKAAGKLKKEGPAAKPSKVTKVSGQKPKANAEPQRRSTRAQSAVKPKNDSSDDVETEAKEVEENKEAAADVVNTKPAFKAKQPSKRKAKEAPAPAPPSKRVKPELRSKATKSSQKSVQEEPVEAPEPNQAGPKPQKNKLNIGHKELSGLNGPLGDEQATIGPRKTRYQQAEEEKKKEEEAMKKPNAGRVAKERHQQKGKK